jgi:LPS export ABC transporter protein LptC
MSPRNLLALLIVLSVAALIATLVMNLQGTAPEQLLEVLPKQVDLSLEKIHYTQTEGGRRRWTLDADSAAYQREEGLISLQNVEMVFYETGRYGEVKMTARQGLFDQQQEQVEVWGEVEIMTDRDEHFYTERLRYEQGSGQVSSDRRVRMLSPQLELAGEGFLFDLQSGRMRILRDVEARLLTLRDERSEN